MGWTKRNLVDEAYAELALAGYVFDLIPEEMQWALRRMDTMIALWDGQGIKLGYPLTTNPGASDLDQESGLPAWAVEPVYLNLAVRIAAGKGKTLQPRTQTAAADGLSLLRTYAAWPQQMQMPDSMPLGAGNKTWRTGQGPFATPPTFDPLRVGDGGALDFLGN